MVVTNDVEKLQFKFYQNQIRFMGLNSYFSVIGTAKKVFFGPSIISQNLIFYLKQLSKRG